MKKIVLLLMITCMVMIPTMVSHAQSTSFNYSNVARGSAKQTSVIQKEGWASAKIYVGSLGGSEWIYRVRLKSTGGKFVTEQLRRPSTEQKDYYLPYNNDGNGETLGRDGYKYCLNCAHYSQAPLEKAGTSGTFTP